jgi:CRISPR-associated protein (TIGR03986 family)
VRFHNPYHFVPVAERASQRQRDLSTADFDAQRAGHVTHDRYCEGTYSGRIVCRLTAEDPLFIGSERTPGNRSTPGQAKPFELEDRPAIPASSLRGLMSSIAEAASNSALRVLENRSFSFRKPMDRNSLSAMGMVIVKGSAGKEAYSLLPLTLPTLEAAAGRFVLPRAYQGVFSEPRLRVYIGDSRTIRDANPKGLRTSTVMADGRRMQMYGMRLARRQWRPNWEVPSEGAHIKADRFLVAACRPANLSEVRRAEDITSEEERRVYTFGLVRVLGCWGDREKDIPTGKKHELFLPFPEKQKSVAIPRAVVDRFHALADERTEASKTDSAQGRQAPLLPFEPKDTPRNPETGNPKFRLKHGDIVFFACDLVNDKPTVSEVSLSSIWRGRVERIENERLVPATTRHFFSSVDPDLVPFAHDRQRITLAEQLFGFVEDREKGEEHERQARALASRVRFSHGLLGPESGSAEPYGETVRLRILDTPKPPSPSLYFKHKNPPPATGENWPGIAKTELSYERHTPQGRKFYLHRNASQPEPWKTTLTGGNNDNWTQFTEIRPFSAGLSFYFHIDFDNLSRAELGLLRYALRPTADYRHKIGMGKPIGLGKIRIDPLGLFLVDRHARYTANGLFQDRYGAGWMEPSETTVNWPARYDRERQARPSGVDLSAIAEEFRQAMNSNIRRALELLGNPAAVTADVGTPQVEGAHAEKETFQWFVANERPGPPVGLKPLTAQDSALPTLPKLEVSPRPRRGA